MPWSSKEKRNIYMRQYYLDHKLEISEWRRRYNQAHKLKRAEQDGRYALIHKAEIAERKKRYYHTCKVKIRQTNKQYCLTHKVEVLTHYGNGKLSCVVCGFEDIRALSIDHINGGGNRHRQVEGAFGGTMFYRWLKINHFPEGYQTLCMNCQWIKRYEAKELYKALSNIIKANDISTIQGALKLECLN